MEKIAEIFWESGRYWKSLGLITRYLLSENDPLLHPPPPWINRDIIRNPISALKLEWAWWWVGCHLTRRAEGLIHIILFIFVALFYLFYVFNAHGMAIPNIYVAQTHYKILMPNEIASALKTKEGLKMYVTFYVILYAEKLWKSKKWKMIKSSIETLI